jgi:predicted dehydrogenase
MKRTRPIGVGVVGLGFMGRTHVEAYRAADAAGFANRLVAVCDASPERRAGVAFQGGNITQGSGAQRLFDPALVRACERFDDLLADERVELVSICTPTKSHVDLAVRALRAGKHVLVEKPLSLSAAALEPLARAAEQAATLCLPAHCMRFWPGWDWLVERLRAGSFGAPHSAVFFRLGSRPDWSPIYADLEATGGALVDLHLHDADFVRHAFGEPRAVSAGGSLHHVTALYELKGGPAHLAAEGGWDHTGGFPFRMGFRVACAEATVVCDSSADPVLRLHRGGASETVPLAPGTGYDGEVRHLLAAIAAGGGELRVSVADALGTARLLDAERESLRRGGARVDLR